MGHPNVWAMFASSRNDPSNSLTMMIFSNAIETKYKNTLYLVIHITCAVFIESEETVWGMGLTSDTFYAFKSE